LNGYRQTIDMLESELIDAADQVQGEMDEIQLLTGSKNHEIAELNALYEIERQPAHCLDHPPGPIEVDPVFPTVAGIEDQGQADRGELAGIP
jgi:hypothetical protein